MPPRIAKVAKKGEKPMKAEYINPFIQASQKVIQETTGFAPTLGQVYVKKSPFKGHNVAILIGITGAIQGNVTISLNKSLVCKIVSMMMGGYPVPEVDEIAKSGIAELSNMILGNVASIFFQSDIEIDITPPTVLVGDNMEFSPTKSTIISIPLQFDEGDSMEIDVSYVEK